MKIIQNSDEYFKNIANPGDNLIYIKYNPRSHIIAFKEYKLFRSDGGHLSHLSENNEKYSWFTPEEITIILESGEEVPPLIKAIYFPQS